jgi:DNA-binding transcriptional MerR regulator
MKYLPFRKTVLFKEKTMTVYSIGWLALLLGRHPMTVRKWEKDGTLPKPVFGDQIDKRYRYYTPGEILGYARIAKRFECRSGRAYPPELKDSLHTFRSQLKAQMDKDPSNVLLNIPDEGRIEKALQNNDDRRQRRTANVLSVLTKV